MCFGRGAQSGRCFAAVLRGTRAHDALPSCGPDRRSPAPRPQTATACSWTRRTPNAAKRTAARCGSRTAPLRAAAARTPRSSCAPLTFRRRSRCARAGGWQLIWARFAPADCRLGAACMQASLAAGALLALACSSQRRAAALPAAATNARRLQHRRLSRAGDAADTVGARVGGKALRPRLRGAAALQRRGARKGRR